MTCFGNFSFWSGETAVKDEARTNRYSFLGPATAFQMGFDISVWVLWKWSKVVIFPHLGHKDAKLGTAGCKTSTWVRYIKPFKFRSWYS